MPPLGSLPEVEIADLEVSGLDALVGLELTQVGPDAVSVRFDVTPALHDASGALHRGVVSAAVESVGSIAGAAWYEGRGHVVGISNSTSHYAPTSAGTVTAAATPVFRGDLVQEWTVDVTCDGTLLARGVLQIANVPDAGRLGH